jgi:hypothetical protein
MLAWALAYARAGYPVFPVRPDKTPYTPNGFHDATLDAEQITAWWTKYPEAGIGCAANDVVDVDTYKPSGTEALALVEALVPPNTPRSSSGGGGVHFHFAPGTLARVRIAKCVDNRYAGSNYVILPQSFHGSGQRYTWEPGLSIIEVSPPPAPTFIPISEHTQVVDNGDVARAEAREYYERIDGEDLIEFDRNKHAWFYAKRLIEQGMTDTGDVEQAVGAWVVERCSEFGSTVDVPKQVRGALKSVAQAADRADVAVQAEPVIPISFKHEDIGKLIEAGVPEPEMLVDDLIPRGQKVLPFGKGDAGKTWLMLSAAKAVIEKHEHVFWLDHESSAPATARRMITLGTDPALLSEFFLYLAHPAMTLRPQDVKRWERMVSYFQPALVVGDAYTELLAACGLEENSGTDVAEYDNVIIAPVIAAGGSFVPIDHVGHDDKGRPVASRHKGNSARLILRVVKSKAYTRNQIGELTITVTKNNDDANVPIVQRYSIGGTPFTFELSETSTGLRALSRLDKAIEFVVEQHGNNGSALSSAQLAEFVGRRKQDVVSRASVLAGSPYSAVQHRKTLNKDGTEGRSYEYYWDATGVDIFHEPGDVDEDDLA